MLAAKLLTKFCEAQTLATSQSSNPVEAANQTVISGGIPDRSEVRNRRRKGSGRSGKRDLERGLVVCSPEALPG
jgi:hypothetical protein